MDQDNQIRNSFDLCNICGHCTHQIMDYGHHSFIIFKDVLEATLNGGCLVLSNNPEDKKFYDIVKFLEKRKYVLTTEVSKDEIGVITNYTAAFFDMERNYLCWCEQPSFSVED